MLTWARHEEFGDDGGILCEGTLCNHAWWMTPCSRVDWIITSGYHCHFI